MHSPFSNTKRVSTSDKAQLHNTLNYFASERLQKLSQQEEQLQLSAQAKCKFSDYINNLNSENQNQLFTANNDIEIKQFLATNVGPFNWNYTNGLNYLLFAYSAYCNPDTIPTWQCKYCNATDFIRSFQVSSLLYDPETDIFGYIGVAAGNQIIVSIRGTVESSKPNILLDLENELVNPYDNDIAVHKGFHLAYESIKPQLEPELKKLVKKHTLSTTKVPTIIFTGHSLGAAVAMIAALDSTYYLPSIPNLAIWTYGCPRTGNEAFVEAITSQSAFKGIYRITNDHDIIPHYPLRDAGYIHIRTEVWERGCYPSNFTVCNGSGEDPRCSAHVFGRSVYDHLHYFGIYEDCPYH